MNFRFLSYTWSKSSLYFKIEHSICIVNTVDFMITLANNEYYSPFINFDVAHQNLVHDYLYQILYRSYGCGSGMEWFAVPLQLPHPHHHKSHARNDNAEYFAPFLKIIFSLLLREKTPFPSS